MFCRDLYCNYFELIDLPSTPVIINVVFVALKKVFVISLSEGKTLSVLNSKFISVMIDPELHI